MNSFEKLKNSVGFIPQLCLLLNFWNLEHKAGTRTIKTNKVDTSWMCYSSKQGATDHILDYQGRFRSKEGKIWDPELTREVLLLETSKSGKTYNRSNWHGSIMWHGSDLREVWQASPLILIIHLPPLLKVHYCLLVVLFMNYMGTWSWHLL